MIDNKKIKILEDLNSVIDITEPSKNAKEIEKYLSLKEMALERFEIVNERLKTIRNNFLNTFKTRDEKLNELQINKDME